MIEGFEKQNETRRRHLRIIEDEITKQVGKVDDAARELKKKSADGDEEENIDFAEPQRS